jgi:hypothetical protein
MKCNEHLTLTFKVPGGIICVLTTEIAISILEMLGPEAIWYAEPGRRELSTGLAIPNSARRCKSARNP